MILSPKVVINIGFFSKIDPIEKMTGSFIDIKHNSLSKKITYASNLITIFLGIKVFLIPNIKYIVKRDFYIKHKQFLTHLLLVLIVIKELFEVTTNQANPIKSSNKIQSEIGRVEDVGNQRDGITDDNGIKEETQNNYTRLHRAILDGELGVIKSILKNSVIMNEPVYANSTALHIAAEMGEIQITKVLIKHDADLNLLNSHHCTPLHIIASQSGKIEIAKLLIQNNANLNIKGMMGLTPLDTAFYYKNEPCIQLLIQDQAYQNHDLNPLKLTLNALALKDKNEATIKTPKNHKEPFIWNVWFKRTLKKFKQFELFLKD